MTKPAIEVKNFTLKKGGFQLRDITFDIMPREIFAVLGKTGSGKTMLLESVAGFYKGTAGGVYINGRAVLDISLAERHIGFVYQDFGLFPHMTAAQNIQYGLRMRHMPKAEAADKVMAIAETLSITQILDCYPGTMSGGEKQRTALARALVLNPSVLLLDEPFSALDPVTKRTMYDELLKIHSRFGCAILFVTHDFTEAQKLASRIGVMDNGYLKAVRESTRLFEDYEDTSVNKFFGIEEAALYDVAGAGRKAERWLSGSHREKRA